MQIFIAPDSFSGESLQKIEVNTYLKVHPLFTHKNHNSLIYPLLMIHFLFSWNVRLLFVKVRSVHWRRTHHKKGHQCRYKTWTWDCDLSVKMHFPNKALQNWFLKIKDKWFRLAVPKCLNEKTHKYICERDRHKYGRFDALT